MPFVKNRDDSIGNGVARESGKQLFLPDDRSGGQNETTNIPLPGGKIGYSHCSGRSHYL